MMTKKACVALLCIAMIIAVGCAKQKHTQLEFGKQRLLGENKPIDAAENLQRSIKKEPRTRLEAQVYLIIAYRRAMAEDIAALTRAAERFQATEQELLATVKQSVPQTADVLILIINDQNRVQQDAAQLLIDLGPDAVPSIVQGLTRFERIQPICLNVLQQIGSSAVDGLLQAATNSSTPAYVRTRFLDVIANIGDAKAIPALRDMKANAQDAGIQMEATVALYRLGDNGYESEILAGLDSDHILVRRTSARTLAEFNTFPTIRVLKALDDPDATVRLFLIQALGTHPDPSAIDPLVRILFQDPDESVKNAAREALVPYGESLVKRMIKELPKQEDWKVRLRILTLLQDPKVISGIDADGAYELDKYFRMGENHPTAKAELSKLLRNPALPQP